MTDAASINCMGLSTALTFLRIKQALIGKHQNDVQVAIRAGEQCDQELLINALGTLAKHVRFN